MDDSVRVRLLRALRGAKTGLNRSDFQKKSGFGRLTAQQFRRLLQPLLDDHSIETGGVTRGRWYRLPTVAWRKSINEIDGEAELRERLSRPVGERKPVSYRRSFLDAYAANRTFYLSDSERRRLGLIGKTQGERRPAGTYARQILSRLLIDLSHNSSRLEGNTYSLLDTERLLEAGEAASDKDRQETQMILNHKAAIEFLVEGATESAIDERTIRNLHALLTDNMFANPIDAGRLRTAPVAIERSVFTPLSNPQLIEECFRQLLSTAAAIQDPFEQAFFLLVHLPYLQPFIDGNKRTARLASNIPFIQQNLIPLSFVDVPVDDFTLGILSVYEENRIDLLRSTFTFAYERSVARYAAVKASLGEPDPFRLQYREQLRQVVAHVVRNRLGRTGAFAYVDRWAAQNLAEEARIRFRVVIETELDSLHEGNYARFQLRPSEFESWQKQWTPSTA